MKMNRGWKFGEGEGDKGWKCRWDSNCMGEERRNGMWIESLEREQRMDKREIDILGVRGERRAHMHNRREGCEFESFLGMVRSLSLGNA
jgi:hypothetical protein